MQAFNSGAFDAFEAARKKLSLPKIKSPAPARSLPGGVYGDIAFFKMHERRRQSLSGERLEWAEINLKDSDHWA